MSVSHAGHDSCCMLKVNAAIIYTMFLKKIDKNIRALALVSRFFDG